MDHKRAREFAEQVVKQLRAAGYQSLWAGGCVRDLLLNLAPTDYDVATDATPQQVREVFGRRRTVPIGAAFGVMLVQGPHGAGQVEVATFRCDGDYADGRHPDSVTFSTARQDAKRRDFTINGLFYDPIAKQTIDYVNGQKDLQLGIVRAVGDPQARFAEDKLRMLRAIRFAAMFEFQLDAQTAAAIATHCEEVRVVSAERIAAENRRMLADVHRDRAVLLLRDTGLLRAILPLELTEVLQRRERDIARWEQIVSALASFGPCNFEVALAALLWGLAGADDDRVVEMAGAVGRHWKLSNRETHNTSRMLGHQSVVRRGRNAPWPRLQPILVHPGVTDLLQLATALSKVADGGAQQVEFCREKSLLPQNELNPTPLLTGDDLVAHGVARGKIYRDLLGRVRDAQLKGDITTRDEALTLVDGIIKQIK